MVRAAATTDDPSGTDTLTVDAVEEDEEAVEEALRTRPGFISCPAPSLLLK